jgi:regulatory protein
LRKGEHGPRSGPTQPSQDGVSKPSPREAPPDPLTAALRMLARRPYSIAEMRRALARKYPENDRVGVAIARLRELGYLDDRKFAEQYAYSLAQNRAYGPHRLRRELKHKLVDYKYIEPAIEQAYQQTTAGDLLQHALEKKLRAIRLPLTRTRFHSLCQSLLRLGFNSAEILKAVRARPELSPVAEEVEVVDLETGPDMPDS